MKKLCAVLAAVMLLAMCGSAFALRHMDREEKYVRDEAARRGMKLLTVVEVREIAAKQFEAGNVSVKEVELEDEWDDYPNADRFRPVYKVECYVGRDEYDIDIDAVTGKVLKLKLDD